MVVKHNTTSLIGKTKIPIKKWGARKMSDKIKIVKRILLVAGPLMVLTNMSEAEYMSKYKESRIIFLNSKTKEREREREMEK